MSGPLNNSTGANSPEVLQRFLVSVSNAAARGDMMQAMELSEQAVSLGFEQLNLLVLAAYYRMNTNNLEPALALLLRAREMAPDNTDVLNAIGVCLMRLGRHYEAITAFDEALVHSPNTAFLYVHKAQLLEETGAFAQAREALERATAIDPKSAEAFARLAGLCARRGEMVAARDYANRALAIAPLPAATIAVAMADIEEKNFQAACDSLAPLLADANVSPVNRSIAFGLVGDAMDGMDRPADAFQSYTSAREILRTNFADSFAVPGADTALDRAQKLATYFESAPVQSWRKLDGDALPGSLKSHVFFVGFPRSGTTLLEQVLANHPDIETLEEHDCLSDAARDLLYAPGGLDRLANLTPEDAAPYREAYWRLVASARAMPSREVFVDKMPLNTVLLPLVARLFPNAKILFALRDPRDVVLSCFRRRLVMTAQMYEFVTLARTAAYYDAVMRLGQIYRETFALPTLDMRHEDLIENFDSEARRACDFLGVTWNDSVRDFAQGARTREIKTPSATQVARGLSREGVGQWRRYRAQLEPVLPILKPWAERFGHSPD
jgi:tetratricopeptide (TPR) repeat protein